MSYEQYINASQSGNTVFTDDNGKVAIIPKGFYIVPGLDDVDAGLVISDIEDDTQNIGNQFVWVPVPKFSEFIRENFGSEDYIWWQGDFVSDKLTSYSMYEPVLSNTGGCTNDTAIEVTNMYNSVKNNGGFYIGRYETGIDDSNNTIIKKNSKVYNNIKWANSMNDETGGAVEEARKFDSKSGYTNVTSTLVYGVQWDAIMRWISRGTDEEKTWLSGNEKGNFKDEDSSNNPDKTGNNEQYQVKHIYDLAGNVWEWTMEAYDTFGRINRGVSYANQLSDFAIFSRNSVNPDQIRQDIGFRIALYL